MKYELKQQFQIESARFLPNLPKSHPCASMHGHSFKLILTLTGDLDPKIGWVMDYHMIAEIMAPYLKTLDHCVLNQVQGLENPTSELLAKWIFDRVRGAIPLLKSITVKETENTECTYPAN